MLSLLHTYVTVYELRNFSKAAEVLYISQPTVSVHIQKLEEMTDTPLFIRNEKKSVQPTEFGDLFIKSTQLNQRLGKYP
ncbi:LysR family transcriptional regulator [Brochothrix thermosphacta]|uniref:LysR family transcriptional regulator n=1 Tax=Brochothrix thermosphacta TaxID=2756 RepID=UPI000EA07DF7|nr:LysR family transcriptional regulator [Brochothrix thermosphacta]